MAEIGSKTELKISEIKERKRKSLFNTSSCLEKKSKLNPTSHKLSKKKKKIIRRKETLDACMAIHRGTKLNKSPS